MVSPVSSFSLSSMAMAVGMKVTFAGFPAPRCNNYPDMSLGGRRNGPSLPHRAPGSPPPLLHRPCPRVWTNNDLSIVYEGSPGVARKLHFHFTRVPGGGSPRPSRPFARPLDARVPAPAPSISYLQISQGTVMSTTMSASAVLSEPRLSRASRPRERCIVVSDRLPIALTREEGQGGRVSPARGELISALTAVLGDRRGVWIGWPGVTQEETPELRRVLAGAIHAGGLSLRPVMLTAEERRNACGGFSGEVIWPLFHGLTEEHNFQPAYWQAFRKVNRKFARATARTLARGASANDLVWVHEPLLLNLARELRGLKAGCRTAFFLHLPFPTPDLYLRLPWREEILGGLLAFDQAGFQTELDLANFLACVRMLAPGVAVAPAGGGLWSLHGSWQGSAVGLRAGAFPVGIDARRTEELAARPAVERGGGVPPVTPRARPGVPPSVSR